MQLFDTHIHLADERFDGDRQLIAAALPDEGVGLAVEACCDIRTADGCIALAESYPHIYTSAGTHPHEAESMTSGHLLTLEKLLSHEKVVAVGEIGLDYHYDFSPREIQKRRFAEQLELACALKKPVILHIREAFGDAMDILNAHRGRLSGGVMHCFSGSYEIARECVDMGLYIAFGGALTFSNARKLVEAAEKLPLDRIVIETDCPYMTPVPHRGKRNQPSYVRLVAERLAQIKGISPDEAAKITFNNALELFNIHGN